MHSKLRKKTIEAAICRRSWKFCSTVKTKALARRQPPFQRPSYASPLRVDKRTLCLLELDIRMLTRLPSPPYPDELPDGRFGRSVRRLWPVVAFDHDDVDVHGARAQRLPPPRMCRRALEISRRICEAPPRGRRRRPGTLPA